MTSRNRKSSIAAASSSRSYREHHNTGSSSHQQPQRLRHRQCTTFYRRLSEAVQSDRPGSLDDLLKWTVASYATVLKSLDKSVLQLLHSAASGGGSGGGGTGQKSQQQKQSAGEGKLAKFRSRGLAYSVRHISPAILRRQRADHNQSKELSAVIEDLQHHSELWDAYLAGFRDTLGTGLTPEQRDAIVRLNDDRLYEIYKTTWPLIDKLNAMKADSD